MHPSRSSSSGGRLILAAGLCTLLSVGGYFAWMGSRPTPFAGTTVDPSIGTDDVTDLMVRLSSSKRKPRPPRPPSGFVGTEACARCHSEIAETYVQTAMYRSTTEVTGHEAPEVYDDERTTFRPPLPHHREYRVERTDKGVFHHEVMLDARGKAIYDQAVRVHFRLGSNTRGSSHVIDHDGICNMSAISWFSSQGGHWNLSPGYENREQHPRFERPVTDECLICHAGRVNRDPEIVSKYREPMFLEMAIGCERCHGPGEEHVRAQEADEAPVPDPSIVNPARLEPAARDSVCYQCHLQGKMRLLRYGREEDDFRPGQRMEEIWTVLAEGTGIRGSKTKAVSHVEQMQSSKCFQKSAGELGCATCHHVHVTPPRDRAIVAEVQRNNCLKCHADQGCSLPLEERTPPPAENSCIHCHMPRLSADDVAHASQTDHRIVRRAEESIDGIEEEAFPEVVIYGDAEKILEPWEIDRVKGLMLLRAAEEQGGEGLRLRTSLSTAKELLEGVLAHAPDDMRTLDALGAIEAQQERYGAARVYWETALKIQPKHEFVLKRLVALCSTTGDYENGLRYMERLIDVNPWQTSNYVRKAELLQKTGDAAEFVKTVEKAVKLDPSAVFLRKWLVSGYMQVGDEEGSRRESEIVARMTQY